MLSPAVVRGSIVSLAVLSAAPGELISRAESARFFSCGAANGFFNPFP